MKPAYIAVDAETEGLRWYQDKLHGFAVAWGPTAADARYFPAGEAEEARALLSDPEVDKVGHRVRFDWKFLVANGFELKGQVWCTKVLYHLLNENEPNGLKYLAEKYLGSEFISNYRELEAAIEQVGGKHVGDLCKADLADPAHPWRDLIARYCVEDAVNTWRLFGLFGAKLKELDARVRETFNSPVGPLDYYLREAMPAEVTLRKMEQPGLVLDLERVRAYGEERRAKLSVCDSSLRELAAPEIARVENTLVEIRRSKLKTEKSRALVVPGSEKQKTRFNLASPAQLGRLLYEELGASGQRTKSGAWCTDETQLLAARAENGAPAKVPQVVDAILEIRGLQKQIGTYVDGFLQRENGGRIYAEYPQFTDTGRLSSVNPNMQNIPRGSLIKRAFKPDQDGQVFIYFDYSQVELRIAAHLSQDPVMLDWFRLGIDPHRSAAVSSFGIAESEVTDQQRQAAKKMNFLTIYDGRAGRLCEVLAEEKIGSFSVEDCELLLDNWWEAHPEYRLHLDRILATTRRLRALVAENGRLRRLPDIQYGDWIDYRSGRFVGPNEVRTQIEEEIASGKASQSVLEAPNWRQVFVYASLKYSHAKKQAFNFPVQSVGASITKAALVALDRAGYSIKTTVHDSGVVQVPRERALEEAEKVKQIAESAYKLSVPLKVDLKILNSLDESDLTFPKSEKKAA